MAAVEPREYALKDGRRVTIRSAQISDVEGVLEQIKSVLAERKYTATTIDDDMSDFTVDKEKEWINKHIEQPGHLFIVAEVDSKIVGSVDLRNGNHKRTQHVGILGITVIKEFRGLGVGKALMETLLNWASDNPLIEKVSLEVFGINKPAIGLYSKLGFIEEGRKIKAIKLGPDSYIDSILMYKFIE
jgi:RimJ/RimL family protein N-acetyltransferase